MTNERIEEILEKANEHNLYSSDYNKAKTAFDEGDITLCLETLLGNIEWLTNMDICTIDEIPINITKGKTWHFNGILSDIYTYENGILNGERKSYYENGMIRWECNYINGLIEGARKSYYENGIIKDECIYINGNIEGDLKSYYDNG